jgi:hypothetical protein
MALELDRVLQQLTQDFNKFRQTFNQTTTSAQKTFVQAETTVKGMIASAGGSAWSTFTRSFELVGIQVTRFFLPTIIMASEGLQSLAGFLDGLTGPVRETVMQFATVAGGAVVLVGAMRLLGFSISPLTVGFGLLLIAVQGLAKWLDDWIEKRARERAEAVGKQYTRQEVEAHPGFKKAQSLPMDDRKKYLDNMLQGIREELKMFEGMSEVGKRAYKQQTGRDADEQINRLHRQQAMYTAIQRALVFGEKLPETVHEVKPPPLGGGFGVGGLLGMIFPNLKEVFKDLGGTVGTGPVAGRRRPFARDWAVEMQPRFSPVEEARKQFQLQALKSPLEQQLMQDLRKLAQDFNNEKPKNWIMDAARSIIDSLGFR